jgi:thermostable 8-oxoguanine DNA glycosylase
MQLALPFFSNETQMSLFDQKRFPIFSRVEKFFESIKGSEIDRHVDLWQKITPESTEEYFKRYIFAFLSVHSTWEVNVKSYLALKDWYNWINNEDELKSRLISCGSGLHNNRTKFLSAFSRSFWEDPSSFLKSENTPWSERRNEISKKIKGLGLAKSSFALEMIYPLEAQVCCMDVHLFRFFGLDQSKHNSSYNVIEKKWIELSEKFSIPSYIARAIYWNRNQEKEDCNYWAFVFNK